MPFLDRIQMWLAVSHSHGRDFLFAYGRSLASYVFFVQSHLLFGVRRNRRAVPLLLKASRYSDSRRFLRTMRRRLPEIMAEAPALLPAPVPVSDLGSRCLVLAEPMISDGRVERKGVLLASFSATGGRLFVSADREELFEKFHIVLEPSWAGYGDPEILAWLNYPEPVIVQATEQRDRVLLQELGANLIPVEYGAGDWIDPEKFTPVSAPNPSSYNAVSIANYGWWKRNHCFVKAVAEAAREMPGYRAALILARLGKTAVSATRLRSLIAYHGVEANLDILESLPHPEIQSILSSADVLVFTSRKEGSSRVIFEAMCCDCPVIVLKENIGVNKSYINEDTGKLVTADRVATSMLEFRKAEQKQSPRAWYIAHLGPLNTTRKLTKDIQRLFPNEIWRDGDITVKANIPEARYLYAEAPLRPLSHWLRSSYAERQSR